MFAVISIESLALMRIFRGMRRLIRGEKKNVLSGWKRSFSRKIIVTTPKASTRDKPLGVASAL